MKTRIGQKQHPSIEPRGSEPKAGQTRRSAPAEKLLPEQRVQAQGARVGVKPYVDKAKGCGGADARDDLQTFLGKVDRYTGAAVAYARLGKHELAARRLADAREYLGLLEQGAKPVELDGERNMHLGLWKNAAAADPMVRSASAMVDDAAKAVEAAKGVTPPQDAGPAPWKKLVVIFGSSCNPPTGMGGHAGIAAWAGKDLRVDVPNDEEPAKARENQRPDEVWVLPVYRHIFAEKSDLVDYDHRYAMARIAFENLPGLEGRVKVMDAERQLAEKAYAQAAQEGCPPESVKLGTLDLVEHLNEQHPDHQFVIMFGGDTFRDYKQGKWKGGRRLEDEVPLVAIPRKGVDGVAGTEDNAPELSDISSTKVRQSDDPEWLSQVLHPDVLAYMQAHGLYGFSKNDG